MGFDAWFFARLDYQDKNKRMNDKTMEFVWNPYSDTMGDSANILTHVLYWGYSNPPGMGFDLVDDDTLWINN